MKSVLQDWVMTLGLRHQGVLVSAVRGCDPAPKHDPSKTFVRCYRGVILNAFSEKAQTFIEHVSHAEEVIRFTAFRKNHDHCPLHYVFHLLHAIEIVGYKHPDYATQCRWHAYYRQFCRSLHVNPETEAQLDARLNADEDTFGAANRE